MPDARLAHVGDRESDMSALMKRADLQFDQLNGPHAGSLLRPTNVSHTTNFSGGTPVHPVPEPAGMALLGIGALALALGRRRRRAGQSFAILG